MGITLTEFMRMFFLTTLMLLAVVFLVSTPGLLYLALSQHRPPTWHVLAITAIWGTVITIVTLLALGL